MEIIHFVQLRGLSFSTPSTYNFSCPANAALTRSYHPHPSLARKELTQTPYALLNDSSLPPHQFYSRFFSMLRVLDEVFVEWG